MPPVGEWVADLFFFEVVGVDSFYLVGGVYGGTHVVVDHVLRQLLAVDQNDLGAHATRVFLRLAGA